MTKPSTYIIGILVFTMFILGGVGIIGELMQSNPAFGDSDKYTQFNKTFNVYNRVTTSVDSLKTNIEEADTDFGLFGVLNALISSSWQTLRLLVSSLNFMNGVFEGLHTMFGLPTWVPSIIISIITVIIVFAIYSAIFQRDI